MMLQRVLATVVAALTIGWLAGGSCYVSTCWEDCDPCIQQCKCKSSRCGFTQAAFEEAHALVVFEVGEFVGADGACQRVYTEIGGLSVQRARGPAVPGVEDVVRFGRGVLVVNRGLFRRGGAEFEVLQAVRCETGVLVQFQRESGGRVTDLVSMFFDVRGGLVQVTHDARE